MVLSVTFYNTMNPYADDPGTPEVDGTFSSHRQTTYTTQRQDHRGADRRQQHSPRVSTDLQSHGLEALSAAALYSPPEANMTSRPVSMRGREMEDPFEPSDPNRDLTAPQSSPSTALSSSKNLNYILNPSSSTDSPIDPSLVSAHEQQLPTTSSSASGLQNDTRDRYAILESISSQFGPQVVSGNQ